uniref:Putative secreted protein n=1 Tax=Anopheles marajoara TaxID=58244 RepID=A0A2M4CEF9_9DIPT
MAQSVRLQLCWTVVLFSVHRFSEGQQLVDIKNTTVDNRVGPVPMVPVTTPATVWKRPRIEYDRDLVVSS